MSVMARTLWSLSLFFFLIGLLYWITAREPAGVTLLMLCSGASIVAVLPYHLRRRPGEHLPEHELEPSASLWPFIIGAGCVLAVNGLVLGPWLFVPGVALVVRGLVAILGRGTSPTEEASVKPSSPAEPSAPS
jgi:CDP-diglyceride synthetase